MCNYPHRLLPQKHFQIIHSLDPKDVLCRWSIYPIRDEIGKLSALAIDEKRIPTYSTNKIPPSEERDVIIAFFDNDIQKLKWNPGDDSYEVRNEDFYFDENRKYFFIQIESIDEFVDRYPYPYSLNSGDYKFSFKLKVMHDPLQVNYSHCVFKIEYFDEHGSVSNEPSRKSLDKVVIASIRSELIRKAKFSLSDF